MDYNAKATAKTPGRIVFVIDVSGSMGETLASGETKIQVVWQALELALTELTARSTKPGTGEISSRYLIAMFAYSSTFVDLLKGFKPISDAQARQVPRVDPGDYTYTGEVFRAVRDLLQSEQSKISLDSPAPIVCHLTDGEWNGHVDPEPIADEIRSILVPDGHVLLSNIFVSDHLLKRPIVDFSAWQGVGSLEDLTRDAYGMALFRMSSIMPESFRKYIEDEYALKPGTHLLFPGAEPNMIQLGFTVATATGA